MICMLAGVDLPPKTTRPPWLRTIAETNEIYNWGNLIGAFLVHELLGPRPPPPSTPPPPTQAPSAFLFNPTPPPPPPPATLSIRHQAVAEEFCEGDEGCLFFLTSRSGRSVSRVSKFPHEAEVVFLPGTQFQVVEVLHGSSAIGEFYTLPAQITNITMDECDD